MDQQGGKLGAHQVASLGRSALHGSAWPLRYSFAEGILDPTS